MEVKKRGKVWIVLALFLVIFLQVIYAADQEGCYYYPQASEDVYCVPRLLNSEAQTDCALHSDCQFDQYFLPGNDCTSLPDCEKVICNVDCQTHALGKCRIMGGIAVPAVASGEEDPWCNLGCCKFTSSADKEFCQFNLNRYQCELMAKQYGVTDLQKIIFDNSLGMNLDKCNVQYCKVNILPATLTVLVSNQENNPLSGAIVVLDGENKQATTSSNGQTLFVLTPKTYTLKISKEGYSPLSRVVPLGSNSSIQINFTLISAGKEANLSGTVHNSQDQPLSQAVISWGEGTDQRILTDAEGKFIQGGFSPESTVNFTASAIGYISQTVQIKLVQGQNVYSFTLNPATQSNLQGKTYLDRNSNNLSDDPEEQIYGAKIYVDDQFIGYSKYPDGAFQFNFNIAESAVPETHTVSATYQDYKFNWFSFKINHGQTVSLSILLTKPIQECGRYGENPTKNVENFAANHVLGKKEVLLSWDKPCAEVTLYSLEKLQGTEVVDTISIAPTDITYLDSEVEWQGTYTYRIIAKYDSGFQSESPAEQTITLGDEQCEGKYHEPPVRWETFCFGEDKDTRKWTWTCDENNKLVTGLDCGIRDGTSSSGIPEDYYCAQISETQADCKDSGSCNLFSNPFGLYSLKEECYFGKGNSGDITQEKPRNYCYYEQTSSIVNSCKSCAKISSCFDISSKEACQYNNCLSHSCQWINGAANDQLIDYGLVLPQLVTPETGAGYCIDPDYKKDDRCYLCNPSAALFENYYCTAQVCSGLGNCFAANQLSRCQSCGEAPTKDANCYTYTTESECTGGQAIKSNDQGEITLSNDRCGWHRCIWKGETGKVGTCVKDGNADGEEDCLNFADAGQSQSCKIDNFPPQTKLLNAGINRISLVNSTLTFEAQDIHTGKKTNPQQNNALGKLYYCLTSAEPNAPDACLQNIENNNFDSLPYLKKTQTDTLQVDILNASSLSHSQIDGKTYKLKYYSTDQYLNREQLQETVVYVDNVPPQFTINYINDTEGDSTALTVYLEGISEPMDCNFTLFPLLPVGSSQIKVAGLDVQDKQVNFTSLLGVMYQLTVSCTDELGNVQVKGQNYTFDKEQDIDIISPTIGERLAQTSISFKVNTQVGSTCSLYRLTEKVTDFNNTDETGKEHYTAEIPGFIEKEYFNEYKVICKELFTDKTLEDYFQFTIDFTAPSTSISLAEGNRTETPSGYGWEFYFIRGAEVTLECTPEGFACAKTRYCLGEGCDLVGSPDYKDYQGSFSVNETTRICYYSIDIAGNKDFQPLCGQVKVEGYGITLELPEPYTYAGEVWGFSSVPTFDWQFYTKVPTTVCGFDFASGFNYRELPGHKVKVLNDEKKYIFSEFPESVFSTYDSNGGIKSVYVVCQNAEGELGPEKKMNLEYDSSAPKILDVHANPNQVYEELATTLTALTDDKTFCRFSDNSEGRGSQEYLTMPHSFPGEDNKNLEMNHTVSYSISDVGDTGKKDYLLSVQCKNGPGMLSDISELRFMVDYTSVGFIYPSSLLPIGYLTNHAGDLSLSTSKTATCSFRDGTNESLEFIPFSTVDGKSHYYHLEGLSDGHYKYPLQCVMGDHQAEAAIEFSVDTTAPIITEIEDGNYSCGSSSIRVMVYTSEENVSGYYYELYDLGEDKNVLNNIANVNLSTLNKNSNLSLNDQITAMIKKVNSSAGSSSSNLKILIANASVAPSLPLEINVSSLNLTHRYNVKVRAGDMAGNWGEFKESNGVSIVDGNYSYCKVDATAPSVSVLMNDSCSLASPLIELKCNDDIGCKEFKYGTSFESTSCSANQTYNGNKIAFKQKSWLCYFVSDNVGNNNTGKELIDIKDTDGDAIIDRCDNCSDTGLGKVVDIKGCSGQDLIDKNESASSLIDSDKDGLLDSWEKRYNQVGCVFDYLLPDSDGNGIDDSDDDSDDDGYTNHQEFIYETNPCSASDSPDITLPGGKTSPNILTGGNVTTKVPSLPNLPPPGTGTSSGTSSSLSWILFLIGLLLTIGGSGYLIYYYKYSSVKGGSVKPVVGRATDYYTQTTPQESSVSSSWGGKLLQLRRSREEKLKQRSRENIFGEFTSKSEQIPHIDPILNQRGAPENKLQQVAQKYAEHKEEIHPGLKPQEKSLFAKLESLAQKEKPIGEQLGKEEAQDFFNKLKNLSQKRKGK
ncbi:MAG: carboxypeptidase-like regulatory domain-containing protein [Candidatus Woesearchaeota archaeon]